MAGDRDSRGRQLLFRLLQREVARKQKMAAPPAHPAMTRQLQRKELVVLPYPRASISNSSSRADANAAATFAPIRRMNGSRKQAIRPRGSLAEADEARDCCRRRPALVDARDRVDRVGEAPS